MAFECCRGCYAPKRHPGCHAKCEEYISAKAKYDARKAELVKKADITGAIMEERSKKIYKALRGHRKV